MDEEAHYQRQQRRAVLGCAFGGLSFVGAGIVIIVAGLWYEFAPPSDRMLAAMKDEGEEIVGQLEAYKARTGDYPPNLSSAEIVPPSHFRTQWMYHKVGNGYGFELWMWFRHHGWLMYNPRSGWEFTPQNSSD